MKANVLVWNNGNYEPKEIDAIEVFEVDGHKFIAHIVTDFDENLNETKLYRISDWKCGGAFVYGQKTLDAAKERAKELIKKHGLSELNEKIEAAIKVYGICNGEQE